MTATPQHHADEFYRSRGFGGRIGFGERPAVIIVDLIRGFTDPTMPYGADLDQVVDSSARLLDAARSREGTPIVFIVTAYESNSFEDAGWWRVKQQGIASLAAGTAAVEVDARLSYRPGEDHQICKKFASSFFGTDLLSRLNLLNVDTLLISGCATSGCVRATVVDGLQNGFRVQVVE
jgi:nicotinamidase-related amidase